MSLFLTGATGFVGKHLLCFLLQKTSYTITIPIRGKKGQSSEERFAKEIKDFPLFQACDLSRVSMVPKDIETIETSDLSGVSCFIHCAAVVKFNQPLESLLRDNYESVKRIYNMCKNIKFIYISTCYVHPKYLKEPGKAVPIEKALPREEFICDYAYTKYLAEQYLCEQTSEIDIVRLSCVGAPLEDLYPMRGPAHLGILEIGYRRTLSDIWFPDNFQFSVVPVDVVCKHLIEVIQLNHTGLRIAQLAAPADSNTYNISAKELATPIFQETNVTYWKNMPYKTFVWCMTLLYFWIPSVLEKVLDVNYIISSVDNNIVFEPSIELPKVSKEHYLNRTRDYVRRLVKENPKARPGWLEFLYSLFLWVKRLVVKIFFALDD
jgi:nucleoside-diphosphate-sugar epimerase